MLLRFGCENFKSIGEYQEVLFTAATGIKDLKQNFIENEGIREKVLPITALYGANASGKTNLLKALSFIVTEILHGSQTSKQNTERSYVFRLNDEYKTTPSVFDIDFVCDSVHYHYGFSLFNGKVVEEWLFSFSYETRASKTKLYTRDNRDHKKFYFGKSLKGKNKYIAEFTTESELFMSSAARANHDLLGKISKYFEEKYHFRFSRELNEEFVANKIKKYELEETITHFLSKVDTGIARINVKEVKVDNDVKKIRESIHNALLDVMNPESLVDFEMPDVDNKIDIMRIKSSGKEGFFSYSEESLGTRALISILASAFWVLKCGGVFVVDELESSLHTLLSLKVVELFSEHSSNISGAQLVFSTHETQLLNFNSVRRDEIWLTEKSFDGSTYVSSLADFNVNTRSNIQKGYLDGRFGAIPFL